MLSCMHAGRPVRRRQLKLSWRARHDVVAKDLIHFIPVRLGADYVWKTCSISIPKIRLPTREEGE